MKWDCLMDNLVQTAYVNYIFHLQQLIQMSTGTASIKKVNLQQIQRPKTLVVIHYKGKRVSIPLFESLQNITEYLYHQLHKFETMVLEKEQKSKDSKHGSINDVIGFTALEQDKNKLDIKLNILLSMSRLARDFGRSRTDLRELDITNYYKYLQIEPYYGFRSKELIPEYHLFSVLSSSSYSTTYLGRKISDGRFYSVKICRNDSKLAQNELHAMKILHHEQSQFENKIEMQLIPQIEEVRKAQGLYIFIYEYCPGGSLRNALTKKLSEIQCLHYMKQLIWGIHTLHSNFNLIHRALCFQNIQMDFVGNLRLVNFAYCQPCFANNYLVHSNVPESYEQKYQIENVVTPPEVQRSSRYNNLIDFFGVGAVLYQMFVEMHPRQSKKQKEGIEIAIENLMAENIRDRQLFINQIISELHEQKMKSFTSTSSKRSQMVQHERLSFSKIYTGQSINVEEKTHNGIRHQDALKIMKPSHDDQMYYLNPVSKNRKKSKNKSNQKSKQKSKEKSKSKDKITNKAIQSNSITGSDKSGATKKSKEKANKSLNKSVDSRNNSVKSSKSKQSKEKKKFTTEKPSMINPKQTYDKKIIPKIPNPSMSAASIKSPPKSPLYQTTLYPGHGNARSPPKLHLNKSKTKL